MTNMQLLEAIGLLDEQTVLDADQPVTKVISAPRGRLVRQLSAVAACALLLIGGTLAVQIGGMRTKSEAPAVSDDASPTYAAAGSMTSVTFAPTGDMDDTTAAMTAEGEIPSEVYTTTAAWTTTTAVPRTTTTWGGQQTTKPGEASVVSSSTYADQTEVTPAEPEENLPAWPIYMQDLNDILNTADSEQALKSIGLQRLAVLEQEGDASFAIRDGRLYFKQGADESRFVITALGGDYMASAVDSGYTLQYELEYTAASADAFAALITDMKQDGRSLRRFALRADGSTCYDTVYGGIRKPVYETDQGVLRGKLSGVGMSLTNVRLIVRVQWYPQKGHTVLVKTADMIDFVEIGTSVGGAHADEDGYAIGLSLCGAVEGYLDNIHLWLGWSDEPNTSGIHYAPYTSAP